MVKNTRLCKGQGTIEFVLLLPILILIVFGALELGRAFFAFIAISNAAREGARVFTFRPDVTTISHINTSINSEVGNIPTVEVGNISARIIECGTSYSLVTTDADLKACPKLQPIRVTLTYNHTLVFEYIFPQTIVLRRSVEMLVP
jgi:Flp pilus assembly protein TadG